MGARLLPDTATLRRFLDYEPATGVLRWRERSPADFTITDSRRTAEGQCKVWNKRFAGKVAFSYIKQGYRQGRIGGVRYNANRIIWKWMTGHEPKGVVDHIDSDTLNDRWDNLQSVSQSANIKKARRTKMRLHRPSVRGLKSLGESAKDIASKFNVNERTIHRVCSIGAL